MYSQKMPNGVLKNPKNVSANAGTYRNGNWEDLLAAGENPKGFTAVTPNGVSRVSGGITGTSNNYGKREDGDHYDYASEIAPALPRR
jgi:hypothetical protein